MTVSRENIDALTGLRFVAAFTIVAGHTMPGMLPLSAIGMPLFFTLSGFIIHYVYAGPFAAGRRRAGVEFAIARFSRIYPLYVLLLVYSLLRGPMAEPFAGGANLPLLAAYFLGCWTWWPFTFDGTMPQTWYYHISWSVSTELFFYFCYALVLYRLAHLRSFIRCLALLIAFCVASYVVFYALFLGRDWWEPLILAQFPQFVARTVNFDDSFYRWLLYVSPYARIFEFVAGVLACQLFVLARRLPRLPGWTRPGSLAAVAIAAYAVLFALFWHFGEHEPWLAGGNRTFAAFLVSLHMNFLFAPCCCLLIFALALGGSALSRAFASGPARFLGDISYSTYLSHPMAERVLVHARIEIGAAFPHVLAVLAVVFAMSWALYSLVEVPAKRGLRRLLEPRLVGLAAAPRRV